MEKETTNNYKKLRFALEYFKAGKNASAAARALGLSASHGSRLARDGTVRSYLSELEKMFTLDRLAQPDKDKLESSIADITEILETLTRIVRREETDDSVIVLKNETVENTDSGRIVTREAKTVTVETRPTLSEVTRAADMLIKYYNSVPEPDSGASGPGGVIILSAVRSDSPGNVTETELLTAEQSCPNA